MEDELVRRDYMANEGWETFLSYEDTRRVFWNASLSLNPKTHGERVSSSFHHPQQVQ